MGEIALQRPGDEMGGSNSRPRLPPEDGRAGMPPAGGGPPRHGDGFPPGARRGARRVLISLVLAAAIPVLLFGGWVTYLTADGERAAARRAAFETTVRVADRVQADLSAQVQVLNALAVALALEEADLPRFYAEAQRLKAAQPLWETVELSDTAGTQILNLLRPLGSPLGPTADRDSFDEGVRTLRPVVGGIGPVGAISGKRLVSLRVPVVQGGRLRYVLTVALATNAVSSILREAGAPKDWVGAIVDRRGNIIARTVAEEAEIGRPASPTLREAIARAPEGFYVGPTLEGIQTETVYRTLPDTGGWSVHFGVPTALLDAPVSRSWYLLTAGALASLLVAGALAALVSRDLAQRRRDEEVRMALALKVSEERGSVAVEAADLGTLRWDAGRGEITGSERSRTLLDLPRSAPDRDESEWPVDAFLEAVLPDDRARLAEAVRRCLSEDEPLDVEFRVARAGAHPRWVRITGRASRLDGTAGAATVIHGVVADVEPRKRAEAERLDLLRRLSEAQENEQRRIARELHDQVGQTVTGLSIGLKGLERMLGARRTGEEAREHLRWLQSLAAAIGRDIHRAALDLRPTALDDLGLYKALGAYTAEWSRHHGVAVDLQVVGDEGRLPAEVETAVYRIVQEALTNVLKHAEARTVSVLLERRTDALRVIVEDDGKGFEPESADGAGRLEPDGGTRPRLGLSGIRERLALVGGTLTLESAPGSGTTLFVQIPLQEAPP